MLMMLLTCIYHQLIFNTKQAIGILTMGLRYNNLHQR